MPPSSGCPCFFSTNLASSLLHGETLWDHFDGTAQPLRATFQLILFFTFLPLLMLAGFVTCRYEVQDTGFGIFICWISLLLSLGWLATAMAG